MPKFPLLWPLLAAFASGQVQHGRVATDFWGRVVFFETAATPAGESPAPTERIMESGPDGVRGIASSPSGPDVGGVTGPDTNDNGDLVAYSFYQMHYNGRDWREEYTGVVRHLTDGWEVRYPGQAYLSRDGRWAAFNGFMTAPSRVVDLWTGAEYIVPFGPSGVADDGSLARITTRSLVIYRPGAEPRSFPMPFDLFSPVIDRYATYAAVYGADGLWRVNLATGEVEPWVRECNNCRVLELGLNGSTMLYSQWSILFLVGEPGAQARRLTPEGQLPDDRNLDDATMNGAGTKVIASTPDGIVAYNLEDGTQELLVPGPTSFTREPAVLAPGLWVRQEGRGLANAEIQLDGSEVQSLRRSSSDIVWLVPPDVRLGSVELAIGQTGSPFEPARRTLEIQLAAPTFVLQADAGISDSFLFNWPIITHAATGQPVKYSDAARPGETITVLMTGLNGQGAAVEWLLNPLNVDNFVRPVFESAEPSPENPDWTVVRLTMPQALPTCICALSAIYGNSRAAALITTNGAN